MSKLVKPFGSSTITQDQVNELLGRLNYDPNGPSQLSSILQHPLKAMSADGSSMAAKHEWVGHNNSGDAMRHAEWSADMTRNLSEADAKAFADAHERWDTSDSGQPVGELLMDLMNNQTGCILQQAMPNLNPSDLAKYAMWHDLLQIQPVNISPTGNKPAAAKAPLFRSPY
jgi:hypothetical protein